MFATSDIHIGHSGDLRDYDLTDAILDRCDFRYLKVNGPQLLDKCWLHGATVPKQLLPWIAANPKFHEWSRFLKIVDDEV